MAVPDPDNPDIFCSVSTIALPPVVPVITWPTALPVATYTDHVIHPQGAGSIDLHCAVYDADTDLIVRIYDLDTSSYEEACARTYVLTPA